MVEWVSPLSNHNSRRLDAECFRLHFRQVERMATFSLASSLGLSCGFDGVMNFRDDPALRSKKEIEGSSGNMNTLRVRLY